MDQDHFLYQAVKKLGAFWHVDYEIDFLFEPVRSGQSMNCSSWRLALAPMRTFVGSSCGTVKEKENVKLHAVSHQERFIFNFPLWIPEKHGG